MKNVIIDEMGQKETWAERFTMPLSETGLSFKFMRRVNRARRNNGNLKSIYKSNKSKGNKNR